MRPSSGRKSPARHWRVSVLPAPDGAKSATTFSRASQRASSVKPGKRLTMLTSRRAISGGAGAEPAGHDQHDARERGEQADQEEGVARLPRLHRAVDGERHRRRLPRDVAGQHQRDRKSTRLNSSHVEISYAVFCLKKKSKKVSVSCAFTQGTRDQL